MRSSEGEGEGSNGSPRIPDGSLSTCRRTLVAAGLVAQVIALVFDAGRKEYPVERGTAADLWAVACRVPTEGEGCPIHRIGTVRRRS
jgi:hypothetical protein